LTQVRKANPGGAAGAWTPAAEPPLTARSVLASTLLGADPPELPVAHLVRVAELFGINDNRARVALSRMAASGEAVARGDGRYALAGHLLVRQRRQAASRIGQTRDWDGTWVLAVVTTAGSSAEVRARRRAALGRARLAELREGVWTRPDNLATVLDEDLVADLVVVHGARGVPTEAAGGLWDLDGWATRARLLLAALEAASPAAPADLAPGFVLSAAVLRHLQADPLLPDPLLPAGWPGARLRRGYDAWDAAYRHVLARWGSEAAVSGPGRGVTEGRAEGPRGQVTRS
jgi:phenylacetic acid degradation operon negative regulatory protein